MITRTHLRRLGFSTDGKNATLYLEKRPGEYVARRLHVRLGKVTFLPAHRISGPPPDFWTRPAELPAHSIRALRALVGHVREGFWVEPTRSPHHGGQLTIAPRNRKHWTEGYTADDLAARLDERRRADLSAWFLAPIPQPAPRGDDRASEPRELL